MLSRMRGTFSGGRGDADLAEELESHIEMQTEDNVRAGMNPAEARRAAVLKFGAVESVKESYRDQRGVPLFESLWFDVRYASRQLRRAPGFTLAALVAIALGTGANTAIFSLLNTMMLKPPPISDPDRLVVLARTFGSDNGETGGTTSASPAVFIHWRAQTSVLEDVSAFQNAAMNYTGGDAAELLYSMQASEGFFRAFRLPILHGRTFTPEEDLPNGLRVAVLNKPLWQRRFASSPDAIGKTVSLNGESYTIIGVVDETPGFFGAYFDLNSTDVYVPFRIDPHSSEIGNTFHVAGRLKPGVTREQALERLQASADEFRSKFPRAMGPKDSFALKSLPDLISGPDDRAWILLLVGAVAMVLLIACANVANLLLVRAVNRRREIGIRVAIGAGRRRVIRQLLTESMLLALVGGAIGLLIGNFGIDLLLQASFTEYPPIWKVGIDWHVLVFSAGLSVVTAIVFGLFPALQGTRLDLNSVLKDSGGRGATGLRQHRLRAALVIGEISLAVLLLTGSALLIRSLIAVFQVDRGFETKNVVAMYTSMVDARYPTTARSTEGVREALARVRGLPGVVSAGAAAYLPLQGSLSINFTIVGRDTVDERSAGWLSVSPGYFDVFKIPIKRGREFTDRDNAKSAPVMIINESMAKMVWKDGDPLNDRLVLGKDIGMNFDDERPRQVVGIVGDVRQGSLSENPKPWMYVPQAQLNEATNSWIHRLAPNAWVVRTQTETKELSAQIETQLKQATGLPVFDFQTMNQVVYRSVEEPRFMTVVMGIFGGLAVLLAVIGIYGVMTYTVEQRTQEIGVRIALGAETSQVRNMVVRQGLGLTLTGVFIGLAAAWELDQLMRDILFGVQPRDPIVFFTVPVLLSAVALLAIWLPASRASRVDPVVSLRCE
jgi:predicted permease